MINGAVEELTANINILEAYLQLTDRIEETFNGKTMETVIQTKKKQRKAPKNNAGFY